jgi:hypothetical protein
MCVNTEGDQLIYPGIDGRIILKWIRERLDWKGGGLRIGTGFLNAVMNLRVP